MVTPEDRCPQGWDRTMLLAYVEDELEATGRQDLERHVKECPVCADELESLRQIRSLLITHPESFHPDEEDLYRFASRREDPNGEISAHLVSCEKCREDVELFRKMIDESSVIPDPRPALPKSLRYRLRRSGPSASMRRSWNPLLILDKLVGLPLRWPVPALSAAAVVLIIAAAGLYAFLLSPKEDWFSRFNPQHGQIYTDRRGEHDQRVDRTTHTLTPGQSQVAEEPEKRAAYPSATGLTSQRVAPGGSLSAPPESPGQTARQETLDQRKKEPAVGSSLPELRPLTSHGADGKDVEVRHHEAGETVPVIVQIEDGEGRPIPWLQVTVPPDLARNFHITQATEHTPDSLSASAPSNRASSTEAKPEKNWGLRIEIRVQESGGAYDIDSKLFETPAHHEIASLVLARVNRTDVSDALESLVRRLLEGR